MIAVAVLLFGAMVSSRAQSVSLSSNFTDLADRGTLNLEAALGLSRHWSLSAGAKYNPFSFGEGDEIRQSKQRLFSIGARYWPWHLWSGFWFSAKCQWQEFNRGGIVSPLTVEGDRLGAALGTGYSVMLSRHLNLDLGIGAWAGYVSSVAYSCPRCGRIEGKSKDFFVLPNDLLLSLSFIF